jgi:hypothetical protein
LKINTIDKKNIQVNYDDNNDNDLKDTESLSTDIFGQHLDFKFKNNRYLHLYISNFGLEYNEEEATNLSRKEWLKMMNIIYNTVCQREMIE